MERWEQARWRAAQEAHERRVDALTRRHLQRRDRGQNHPVEDFLYVYYAHRPGRLRRWHPGPGIVLLGDDEQTGRRSWNHYVHNGAGTHLDVPGYLDHRGDAVRFVADLLRATATRPPHLSCFGLHEWAMVYHLGPGERRHERWPLRLGDAGTDEVVESLPIRCTHADAYRFFTRAAAPRNALAPTRAEQLDLEQPGCLHATMDLYKWAFKLSPGIPSDLTLEAFDLARRARELDMRASPYDLRDLGYEPVRIETPQGRAEYVALQKEIASEGAALRARLLAACEVLLDGVLSG